MRNPNHVAVALKPPLLGLVANRCESSSDQDSLLKSLQALSPFIRFVFVMSVLERYADRECALLLDCSSADVVAARIRAFHQISRSLAEMYPGYGRGAEPYAVNADWLECG